MTMKPPANASELLVDDHHGIYSAQQLAKVYTLYVQANGTYDGIFSGDLATLKAGPADGVLSDDDASDDYFDVWDDLESRGLYVALESRGLYVDIDGTFYRVESADGGIFAIHPDAEWSDEDGWYVLPTSEA